MRMHHSPQHPKLGRTITRFMKTTSPARTVPFRPFPSAPVRKSAKRRRSRQASPLSTTSFIRSKNILQVHDSQCFLRKTIRVARLSIKLDALPPPQPRSPHKSSHLNLRNRNAPCSCSSGNISRDDGPFCRYFGGRLGGWSRVLEALADDKVRRAQERANSCWRAWQ